MLISLHAVHTASVANGALCKAEICQAILLSKGPHQHAAYTQDSMWLDQLCRTLAERHMQSRHHEARTEDGVSSMIEGFDRQLIGGVHPHRPQTKAILKQAIQVQEPDAVSGVQTKDELGEAGTHTHVQVNDCLCHTNPPNRNVMRCSAYLAYGW